MRDQIEPKLDDFMNELTRMRGTVEKARTAANEGWRSLNDITGGARAAGRHRDGDEGGMMGDLQTTNVALTIMAVVSVLEALLLIGIGIGGFIVYRRVMQLVNDLEARQIAPVAREGGRDPRRREGGDRAGEPGDRARRPGDSRDDRSRRQHRGASEEHGAGTR